MERFPPVSVTILDTKYIEKEKGYRSDLSIAFKGERFPRIKRVFSKIGLSVISSERRKFGPFNLVGVGRGHVAALSAPVTESLLDKAIPPWREEFEVDDFEEESGDKNITTKKDTNL